MDTWTFLFLGPIMVSHTTTVVLEYRQSKFGLPALTCQPFHHGVVEIGLEQAIRIKNHAGKTEPFTRVHCHWPIVPEDSEPFYIFGGIGAPFVFVGVRSGKVTTPGAESLADGKGPKHRCLDGPLSDKSRRCGARFYFDGRQLGGEEGFYELETVYRWHPIGPPSISYSNDVLGLDVD
jgi:hypothetical protein